MVQLTLPEIKRMRSGLSRLRQDVSSFLKESGYSPRKGSKADQELSSGLSREFLHTVQCQGSFQNELAADHLTAFVKTIQQPMETVAPWNCVRAILESTALAGWFLNPQVEAMERVARGFAHRYEGLMEQAKFSRSAGLDTAQLSKRIDKVESDALALGFQRILSRKGERIGIARKMPSATQLIEDVFKMGESYRLLSAFAHGHFWAIQQVSFSLVPGKKIEPAADGIKLHVIEKSVSLNAVGYLGMTAAEAISRPIWDQCVYYGWDRDRLQETLDRAFDLMGASQKIRCWKR